MKKHPKASGSKKRALKPEVGKKLAGYALAAGATMALGCPDADAAIVYTSNPQTISVGQSLSIDLNNDSSVDFTAFIGALGTGLSQSMYDPTSPVNNVLAGSLLNIYTPGRSYFSYPFAKRLAANALINSTLFTTPASLLGFNGFFYGTYWGGALGNFVGQRGYLGAAFDIGGSTYYAWIDIEASIDLTQLTIYGWAYENVAGTPISAGAVPLPGTLPLLAMGVAGLALWRRREGKRAGETTETPD